MKKIISYTLIASILSTSLIGCAQTPKEGPEIFEQKAYTSDKIMKTNGFTLVSRQDDSKIFEKKTLNGGNIRVYSSNYRNTSDVTKTSDIYADYQSCITAFNEDNKRIQEIISKSEKVRYPDKNISSFTTGGTNFTVKSQPCAEVDKKADVKTYQYEIAMEGVNEKDQWIAIHNFQEGVEFAVALPFMIIGAIIFVPLAYMAIGVFKIIGYKGG